MSGAEALFVACAPGLEGALAEECLELGLAPRVVPGGCELSGPPGTHQTLNLWLRTANRVLLRIADLRRPDDVGRVAFSRWLPPSAPVVLHVSGAKAGAFAEALRRVVRVGSSAAGAPSGRSEAGARAAGRGGEGPGAQAGAGRGPGAGKAPRGPHPDERPGPADVDEGEPEDGPLELFLRGDDGRATLSLDTSGALLHFRGYRQEIGRAPMRETLAAGVLRVARCDPGAPLWDVMCGSGTLLIEAAERALGLAAGRSRRFAFERFAHHDAAAWAALPRSRPGGAPTLLGSDVNAGALGTARRNAKRAGVLAALTLERLDATRLEPRAGLPPGLVVANLPYGRRVGERSELGTLYRGLGKSLRRAAPGWRFAFLLEEGEGMLDLPLEGRQPVPNGGIPCVVVWGRVPTG